MAKGLVDFRSSMKADSTLVGGAYKAAMAGVPKDLTGIFNNIADSYEKAMTQVGAGWAKVGEVVGKVGGNLIKKEVERRNARDAGVNVNEGYTQAFTDRLNWIKDIKGESGIMSYLDGEKEDLTFDNPDYNPNAPESETNSKTITFENKKAARKYAKRMEDNLYAGTAQAEKAFDQIEDMVNNKQIDLKMSGPDMLEFATVLAGGGGDVTNADGEVIGRAVVGFDKKGFPEFSFQNPDGSIKTNKYGQEIRGNKDDIERMLIIKNPKAVETVSKFTSSLYSTAKSGTKWEDVENNIVNSVENLAQDDNTLLSLMDAKWGNMKDSFVDALHKPSVASAEMFSLLSDKYTFAATDKKGNPTVYDVDEDGDVELDDFVAGYEKFVGVITDKQNPQYDLIKSRTIFANWVKNNPAKEEWQKGNNVYNVAQNRNPGKPTKFLANEKSTNVFGGEEVSLPGKVLSNVKSDIINSLNGRDIEGYNMQKDGTFKNKSTGEVISGDQFLDILSRVDKYNGFNFNDHSDFKEFSNSIGFNQKFAETQDSNIAEDRLYNELADEFSEIGSFEDLGDMNDAELAKKLNTSKALRDRGISFDYSTFDFDEEVAVLKDGKQIGKISAGQGKNPSAIEDMIELILKNASSTSTEQQAQDLIKKYGS